MLDLLRRVMDESASIAAALGIELPVSIEHRLERGIAVGDHKTSMLQDVEAGRPLEIDCLTAAVIELADQLDIAGAAHAHARRVRAAARGARLPAASATPGAGRRAGRRRRLSVPARPPRERLESGGDRPGPPLLVLAAASPPRRCRSPRAARPRSCASRRSSSAARPPRERPGRAAAQQRGPDRRRHPRAGVEPVLGDRAQRGRGGGAPDGRPAQLPRARRLQPRAHEDADRRGDRQPARRPRRLAARAGHRPRGAPRRGGRDPRRVDQLRQRRRPRASASSPTSASPSSAPASSRARRLARAGVRRALCVNQQVGNQGLDDRCAGLRRAMREAGGSATRGRRRRPGPGHAAARWPPSSPRRRIDGVLTLNATTGDRDASTLRDSARDGASVDARHVRPRTPSADRRPRRADPLRRRPAGLPAGLPARSSLLAQRARYGLFPNEGDVISTGPHFVTKDNAAQALDLSRRSIR